MILRTQSGDRMVRDANLGALLQAEGYTRGAIAGGTTVTGRNVGGIPAAKEAIRIASEAVAQLAPLRVFRGVDVDRRPVNTTWQARFFLGKANVSDPWFRVFEQTEASLTARNNAYWLKDKTAAGQVIGVHVIHPDGVEPRWTETGPEYRYKLVTGGWSQWLTEREIHHFRVGHVEPGCLQPPSPLKLHKETLRSALSKINYEAGYYDEGLMQALAVEFPIGVDKEQAERFRDLLQADTGLPGRSRIRVVGAGAKITTIGLSLEDSQYVESMQFSVEELGRIFGVPASLLNAGRDAAKPITAEHEQTRWHRYGLSARLMRIETSIGADPDFFGEGSRDYPRFIGTEVHADVATESAALVKEVQAGILLPDEARAKKGLPPLPDGLGQIPQIVPVGGTSDGVPLPTPQEVTN